jgi:phosphatidylglycerol---prolipoprotein diacylglyceryl transferase
MLLNWSFNPTLVSLGPFSIQWYGLLFVSAFWFGQAIMMYFFKTAHLDVKRIDTLLLLSLLGTIIGARLMHCLAYEPSFYLARPLEIFKIWKGGLASHGGALGLIFGLWLGYKLDKKKTIQYNMPSMSFIWLIDHVTIPAALGSIFIRIANFLNSEIVGIPTNQTNYGVIFEAIDNVPRHPVQLYEACAYVVVLFLLIFVYLKYYYNKSNRAQKHGLLFGIFMTAVFSARIVIEFFKTHQSNYEQINSVWSVGQYLSVPCIILGIYMIIKSCMRQHNNTL